MSDQASDSKPPKITPESRRSARLSKGLNGTVARSTPLNQDTAWSVRLKDAVDAAVRDLDVEVLAAKPVLVPGTPLEAQAMLFEIDTNKGQLQATRLGSGLYEFVWVSRT
jgi:hypothetical protein